MKKIKLTSLLLILLCICFTGCAAGKNEPDLNNLKNAEGEFQYPGLDWGSSLVDIEAQLKTEAVSLGTHADGTTESYHFSGVFGEGTDRIELICEFQEDALIWTTFSYFPEKDKEAFFDKMRRELFDAYGTVEAQIVEREIPQRKQMSKSESYFWLSESGSTKLSLSTMYMDKELTSITLSLYPVP